MNTVDNSNHICLICSTTIVGLLPYVEHFKTHAIPDNPNCQQDQKPIIISQLKQEEESSHSENGYNDNAIQLAKPNSTQLTSHSLTHTTASHVYYDENSPLSSFANQEFPDPDIETDALLSPKYNIDFFQSLELKSTNEEPAPVSKSKLKATQRLSILEDDSHAENLLPITSILNNLDFSSDDEDETVGTTNNQERNYSVSDDDETGNGYRTHPPRSHTGGKWKPGQGPSKKNDKISPAPSSSSLSSSSSASFNKKLPIAGKWKPGKMGPASHKAIMRGSNRKKPRGPQADAGMEFSCHVCDECFSDRAAYSSHFGEQKHKDAVAERQKSKFDNEKVSEVPEETGLIITEKGVAEAVVAGSVTDIVQPKVHDITANVDIAVTTKARDEDQYHCPVCDLYFSSSFVFQTHCETKMHKDGLLKQGFKEYRSSNGVIIRIDVRTDAVFTDRQENQLLAARQPKKQSSAINTDTEKHECTVCRKIFKRKYEMARHLLTRMHRVRAQNKPLDEWVEMLDKYNKYMTRLSLFQCVICQYYFNRQRDFLDHMCCPQHVAYCADMLGPIMCVACKYKTHIHAEMMQHLQTIEHYTTVEKCHGLCIVRESHTSITCKFCGIKMHSAARMKRHCQLRHSDRLTDVQEVMDVRPNEHTQHKCPLCEKVFKVKTLLQFHFLKSHKQESFFNCTVCDRGFLDQRRLDNHLRTRFHSRRVIALKLKEKKEKLKLKKHQGWETNKEKKADLESKTELKEKENTGASTSSEGNIDIEKDRTGANDNARQQELNVADLKDSKNGKEEFQNTNVSEKGSKIEKNDTLTLNGDSNIEVAKTGSENVRRSMRKRKRIKFPDEDSSHESEVNENDYLQSSKISERLCSRKGKMVKHWVRERKEDEEEEDPIYIEGRELMEKEKAMLDDMSCIQNARKIGGGKKMQKKKNGKNGAGEEDLDHEVLEEASKSVFSCKYCDFSASDLMELRSHYNDNHPCDILTCQPCNQFFLSLKAFKIHCAGRGHQLKLREQSGETEIHACPLCDKRFLQSSFCAFHVETVHRHPNSEADLERIHKGKDLVTQLYGDHVAQVEKLSNDSSVSCPECGKFVRKETLREHLRLHTGEKPYSCRFCNKSFSGRLTLRRHISSHLDMPLYICDLCGKEFRRNSHLVKHMQQHDNEKKGEKHTCKVCKVWFYTSEELERHKKRHSKRNHKCTWPGCQWLFVNMSELKSHMHTHTKERTYLCDQCGYGAPTKTRLRRHARTHENLRPFACEYCPYKATLKTHLIRHMRIHINSKPFACPYCNFTCNTHENIRKHILKTQKHKGKKLYPCKLCSDYGSNSSSEFKGHLMTVHDDYLRENAVDSLAVFSGLYKREKDFTKPKEGSEIRQVTKGRFFRNYTNPGADALERKPFQSGKDKKVKKETVAYPKPKVVIVSQEEMQAQALQSIQKQSTIGDELMNTRTHSVIVGPHQTEQIISLGQSNLVQGSGLSTPKAIHLQLDEDGSALEMTVEEEGGSVASAIEIPQFVEIPNIVIQDSLAAAATDVMNNNNNNSSSGSNHQLFPVAFTVSSQLDQQLQQQQQRRQPQLLHQQQHQHDDELQQHLQRLQQQQQQQEQQHQLQSSSNLNRVFWVEASTSDSQSLIAAAVDHSTSMAQTSSTSPTHPEPWYSEITQVHPSNCHDIANLANSLEVVESNNGTTISGVDNQDVSNAVTVTEFLPDKYFNVTATQIYSTVAGDSKVVVLDQTASDL